MEIKKIGVLGAGAMGTGIANLAAMHGLEVVLCDIHEEAVQKSVSRMERFMDKSVARGKMTEEEKAQTLKRIQQTTNMEDFKDVDLVIEAVLEDLDLKKSVFQQLDDIVPESALLTTNTSSMSITEIATATKNPSRVAGLHFFNPAQIMKLVEVIRGLETSDETIESLKQFAEQVKKEHVEVKKDVPGFIVNRVMIPHFIESIRLLEEGVASAEDIDKAVKFGLNYPMGPFELQDFAGVDIGYHVMEYFKEEFNDARFAAPLLLKQMIRAGHHGRKTGVGFYDYREEDK